ncbi:MAG: hypothetical protein Q8J65_00675, partial [Nitrosomonadales bacterium]|nr:hypothetical protein [Nitrosomonadales bacterium]
MIENSSYAFLLPLALIVAFAGVAMPLMAERFGRTLTTVATGSVMALSLALLIPLFSAALGGEAVVMHIDWLPSYGFNLAFRLDG